MNGDPSSGAETHIPQDTCDGLCLQASSQGRCHPVDRRVHDNCRLEVPSIHRRYRCDSRSRLCVPGGSLGTRSCLLGSSPRKSVPEICPGPLDNHHTDPRLPEAIPLEHCTAFDGRIQIRSGKEVRQCDRPVLHTIHPPHDTGSPFLIHPGAQQDHRTPPDPSCED